MKQQSFQLHEDGLLGVMLPTKIPSPPRAGNSPLWIDIGNRDPEELTSLLASLDVHPLAIEACLEVTPNARFVAYGDSLFISLPTAASLDSEERTFLSIVCVSGVIITLHETPVSALSEVTRQFTSTRRFQHHSSAAILYEILDHLIDRDMVFAQEARDQVDQLEATVGEESSIDLSTNTIVIKRCVARLESILEDHLHCVSTFQFHKSEALSLEGLHDHFRDAEAHLDHTTRIIDRQGERLAAIHQEYLLKLQAQTNHRLQLLTIISAIFLPLTLITGIYGMNFRQMPELEWSYGYPSILALMIITGGLMLFFFRKQGWFK